MINSNISGTLGRTPLIKLAKLSAELEVNFVVKTESRNPVGSVKDRVAFAMIEDGEKSGRLNPSMTIIEATSGNTGIALAAMGKAKGYKVAIVMPESMSIERRKIIGGLGAELILTPASGGMALAIKTAEKMLEENPGRYFMPNQFTNSANTAIHILTTGPEIEIDSDGKIGAVVAGVGTGGTITGIGTYFKKIRRQEVTTVAVEPAKSPVITQTLAGEHIIPGAHGIQGIGAGFIPKILDLDVVDYVVTVEDAEAISMARKLMADEGVFCGISGGAAVAGAITALKTGKINPDGREDFTVVVILPDSGERYLSTALYEQVK